MGPGPASGRFDFCFVFTSRKGLRCVPRAKLSALTRSDHLGRGGRGGQESNALPQATERGPWDCSPQSPGGSASWFGKEESRARRKPETRSFRNSCGPASRAQRRRTSPGTCGPQSQADASGRSRGTPPAGPGLPRKPAGASAGSAWRGRAACSLAWGWAGGGPALRTILPGRPQRCDRV